MNKTLMLFLMVLIILYFSFVSGRIIAEVDSGEALNPGPYKEEPYMPKSGKPVSFFYYLNPWEGSEVVSDTDDPPVIHGISSPDPSGPAFFFEGFASSEKERAVGGGFAVHVLPVAVSSRTTKSSQKEELNFGPGASNPFGGLISQLSQIQALESQEGDRNQNPTGTFGMKLGGFHSSDTGFGNEKPLSMPLDSGVYILMAVSLFTAAYSLLPKQRYRIKTQARSHLRV